MCYLPVSIYGVLVSCIQPTKLEAISKGMNSMVQRKEAIKLKEEYHAFRDRCGVILFSFALVLLVGLLRADAKREAGEPFSLTPPFMVGVQGFLAWLLYFYTAMALRENVLKVA